MSEERVSYKEYVRAEVEGLLEQARRLRDIAAKWETEAEALRRYVEVERRSDWSDHSL